MLTPGLGHTLIRRCLEAFGSAEATLGAGAAALARIDRISPRKAGECAAAFDRIQNDGSLQRELDAICAADARLITWGEADYPPLLKHIPDPPVLLWVRGELQPDDAVAAAIVGSRRCTHYGREQADRFAAELATNGVTIVSGGAYGVDAAAHRGALRMRGRTLAVIGSGLGHPYPREHAPLFDQIAAGMGAVLSEYPMLTAPQAENFPRRNRIISGLSLGTLVIEAAARSGALITARQCVEEHGRELMALPGRVDAPASAGCHKMIREGWATLVTSASDVLDQLGEAGQLLRADEPDAPPADPGLNDVQTRIVDLLHDERTLDQIVAHTGLPVHQVQSELTMLEVRGSVARHGGLFVKRR